MTDALNSCTPRITRREALNLLGAGAAAACSPGTVFGTQDPQFPAGVVIWTVLDDLSPSALAGGTTLRHEHLTHGLEWNARMAAPARPHHRLSVRRVGRMREPRFPGRGAQQSPTSQRRLHRGRNPSRRRLRAQAASGRRRRRDAARYPGTQFVSVPRVCSTDSENDVNAGMVSHKGPRKTNFPFSAADPSRLAA